MTLGEIAAAFVAILGALGALYKLVVSSRLAVTAQHVDTIDRLRAEEAYSADMYQRILDNVRAEWAKDNASHAAELASLSDRLHRAETRIEELRRGGLRSQEVLLTYIRYLTGLLRKHAPHVEVDPIPTEDLLL